MFLRKRINLRNTLAFRLTLWYAGIFTVSSCIAFLMFYMLVTSFMRGKTDQELLGQVNRFSALLMTGGMEEVRSAAVIEAQAAGVKKVFFRLLSLNGRVFSSSNMVYWKDIPFSEPAVQELLRDRSPVFQTITIRGRKEEVRILYALLSPGIILQVGQAMEDYSRFLDAFKGMFIGVMTLLIILSAGVGWFMARRAVSGVGAVTRTAQNISAGALEERVPVKSQGDEIDQLAITFNQMLDRIQTLVKEIKEMSDNMAHDLKSPVTRIRGLAEVTLSTGKTLSEYENMAASTIEECDRLLDMINTMLMISKTEAGVDKLFREAFDLAALVREACDLFLPTAEDEGLSMICRVPDQLPVSGDKRMIQRMLANLIDNAINYTPSGGAVTVTASENGGGNVILTVKDTGIGIASSDLPRIFDRFYRCDQSRSKPGIGLGLSLARAIARAHGGEIQVESSPNQGSTFTVTLPKS
jgi:heavy metal sensor kinase